MKTKTNTKAPTRFGSLLRQWRKARGLTQAELGEAVNRTPQAVSIWEGGYSDKKDEPPIPSVDIIDALARVLNVPIDEIRLAAGYAPKHSSPSLLEKAGPYWDALPIDAQEDLLAQIRAVYERRRAIIADGDNSGDVVLLPEESTQRHN